MKLISIAKQQEDLSWVQVQTGLPDTATATNEAVTLSSENAGTNYRVEVYDSDSGNTEDIYV